MLLEYCIHAILLGVTHAFLWTRLSPIDWSSFSLAMILHCGQESIRMSWQSTTVVNTTPVFSSTWGSGDGAPLPPSSMFFVPLSVSVAVGVADTIGTIITFTSQCDTLDLSLSWHFPPHRVHRRLSSKVGSKEECKDTLYTPATNQDPGLKWVTCPFCRDFSTAHDGSGESGRAPVTLHTVGCVLDGPPFEGPPSDSLHPSSPRIGPRTIPSPPLPSKTLSFWGS